MAVGPLIGLAMLGVLAVSQRIRTNATRRVAFIAMAAVVVIATIASRPSLAPRQPLGYRGIVTQLAAADQLAGRRLLVVSDEVGEGAAVTEVAVLNLQPEPTIIRGSKLLANDDWMGNHFQMTYASPTALMQNLEDLHIEYVLLDRSGSSATLPYFEQVRALTAAEHHRLERIETAAQDAAMGPTRQLELYRIKVKSPGPPKPLRISLVYTIGRTLQR
jgi:hypothetical protein